MPAPPDQRRPLTFEECRTTFRSACDRLGVAWSSTPISARGPSGQALTIDDTVVGTTRPRRALVVLSGVHGVEAAANSAIQCDLLDRLGTDALPDDIGIIVVHVVNPWGMAHGRRQNESNVDLNRNWARSRRDPEHNDAYDDIHHLLCPDTDEIPDIRDLFAATKPLVAARGEEWVRQAITRGQFRHPDGLHFGGDTTEESTAVVERSVLPTLAAADRVWVLDLHTGHGPYGELTVLSDQPHESPQDRLLRSVFDNVESTPDRPDGSSRVKSGPIARGLADELPHADTTVATIEIGTVDDLQQLSATYHEQWAHRCRCERDDLEVRGIRRRFRECFTPNDPTWENAAIEGGRRHVDAALNALAAGR